MNITDISSNYRVGELVKQDSTGARGLLYANSSSTKLVLERLVFNTANTFIPSNIKKIYYRDFAGANSSYTANSAAAFAGRQIFTYYVDNTVKGVGNVINATPTSTTDGYLFVSRVSGNLSANVFYTTSNTYSAITDVFYDSSIYGEQSGFMANVSAVLSDTTSEFVGLNANISTYTIVSNGAATGIKVVDSGFGFRPDEKVYFDNGNGLGSGIAVVGGSGFGLGYSQTRNGFLSDSKKLFDGEYYQEFSYEVKASVTLDRYTEMLRKVLHVAGTKYFGAFVYDTFGNSYISSQNVKVATQTSLLITTEDGKTLVDETSTNNIETEY